MTETPPTGKHGAHTRIAVLEAAVVALRRALWHGGCGFGSARLASGGPQCYRCCECEQADRKLVDETGWLVKHLEEWP